MDEAELRRRVDELPWYHRIDLGHGIVTPGLARRDFDIDGAVPDVRGRSVLDIGAWDGYFSFLAERRGAARVVALDHYTWGVDFAARTAYWAECAARGVLPDHDRDETDFWRPELPGRRGFDLAHEALGSAVEPLVADFMTLDLDRLGSFDVVLYLGVLYHMQEPLTALRRLRAVTREVAVIETVGISVPDGEGMPLLGFHPGADISNDFGNWFTVTDEALRRMCWAAGFSRTELRVGAPPTPPPTTRARMRRAWAELRGTWPREVGHHRSLILAFP